MQIFLFVLHSSDYYMWFHTCLGDMIVNVIYISGLNRDSFSNDVAGLLIIIRVYM